MNLIDILFSIGNDPLQYSLLFFTYAVLAAVILPIPVEIGLFNFAIHPVILVTVLALGKGVGSYFVFEIGVTARGKIKGWSEKTKISSKIVKYSEDFVKKYGYIGLFIILSTPLMIDSVSLYLFSLLNADKDGGKAMEMRWFVVINIVAGAVRGIITLAVFYYVGVKLVS